MKQEIVFFIGSLDFGGAERHLVFLLPKLKEKGWKVSLVTLVSKGPMASLLENQGIKVGCILNQQYSTLLRRLPRIIKTPLRLIPTIGQLVLLFRKKKEAFFHFFLPETYVIGMLAALLAGRTHHTIMSRRSLNNYQQAKPLLRWLERRLYSKTPAILGNSSAIIDQLHQEEGVPLDKLTLIYNGVDYSQFTSVIPKEKTRTSLGISSEVLVLIIVANLIPYKGHADLLEALALIKDKLLPKDWRLLCVGRNDGIGDKLLHQTRDLGLDKHIHWLGVRTDVPSLLHCADIGLLCSHQEGFSNAILESMAVGLPMIVTNVGGNKEAVIDEKTGYVVPARNPQRLAEAIMKLASDSEKRKLMSVAASDRVHQLFTLEKCVENYDRFYQSLMVSDELTCAD